MEECFGYLSLKAIISHLESNHQHFPSLSDKKNAYQFHSYGTILIAISVVTNSNVSAYFLSDKEMIEIIDKHG